MLVYGRGTWEEYLIDDEQKKIDNNWTELERIEGKINYYKGEKAPDNQRTLFILKYFQNPDLTNDYIWETGDELTEEEYNNLLIEWGYDE